MSTPLSLDTDRREDGAVVLTATGEIDMSNVAEFTRALAEAQGDGTVIVDLRGLDYLDSGGINALFTQVDRIRIIANPVLLPVLTVSGLVDLVDVEEVRAKPEPGC